MSRSQSVTHHIPLLTNEGALIQDALIDPKINLISYLFLSIPYAIGHTLVTVHSMIHGIRAILPLFIKNILKNIVKRVKAEIFNSNQLCYDRSHILNLDDKSDASPMTLVIFTDENVTIFFPYMPWYYTTSPEINQILKRLQRPKKLNFPVIFTSIARINCEGMTSWFIQ